MKTLERAKFVYVARKPCGCVVGLVSDYADKATGRDVAEFIGDGLAVSRETMEKYRDEICNEPGFMDCLHVEKKPKQLAYSFPLGE